MMPPGHVAATWGVATLLQQNNSRLARLDFRLLAVSALLPDLIDKPLAILVFTDSHTSQLIAHSLLLHLLLLLPALLLWPRGLPYALALTAHLWLDRMWHHPESFWWPFFGWNTFWSYKFMNSPEAMVNVYLDIVTRYPQVWVVELVAMAALLWFGYRHRLYQWASLKRFMMTGQVRPAGSGSKAGRAQPDRQDQASHRLGPSGRTAG